MFQMLKANRLVHVQKRCNFAQNATASFEEEFRKNHIQTSPLQRILLQIGCSVVSLLDPKRGDTIACLGEVGGNDALGYMHDKMLSSEEGRSILEDKPRINSKTVDLNWLNTLPEGTLGKTYFKFLEKNQVTPDSRLPVHFVDNINLAYVVQRYRETHDLYHTILGMPTNMLGEVTVKWVEAIQTKLFMCIGGAIFGPVRLRPKHRQLYLDHYLPWAIETGSKSKFLMNIYYEKRWEQPMDELHQELNIKPLVVPKI